MLICVQRWQKLRAHVLQDAALSTIHWKHPHPRCPGVLSVEYVCRRETNGASIYRRMEDTASRSKRTYFSCSGCGYELFPLYKQVELGPVELMPHYALGPGTLRSVSAL